MINPQPDPTSDRILAALQAARTQLAAVERQKQERVAIVGMAGRFPGADSIEQFWQNLCAGISSIEPLSDADLQHVDPALRDHPSYVKAAASLSDIAGFDAHFFGYSPREAELIDPQHRIFLECAWTALEQAGYDPEQYAGAIAVYAGAALNSYLLNLHSHPELRESIDRVQAVISNVMGLMPTRVSYKLNLRGASCGVQTGCSTSLVAVHLACQSLLNGECDMALAGGVAIDLSGRSGYLYQNDGVMSADGVCRAFDAAATGTVFGSGVGIVVLKRLSEAIADKDTIYAVIRGSAVNNDGAQKVGLTAPSVAGQANAIATALEQANLSPETISYIEAHGTGTALGDPIEIAALTKVFRQHTQQREFCAIGSVKTNIGHLDAAAGIAGLIKTALALKHEKLPPSLNFTAPNPQIDFPQSPFLVNTKLRDWHDSNTPRRAAVSSFGMGGTNAHVILEAAPTAAPTPAHPSPQLLILSAKTPTALYAATANLTTYLQQHPDANLADIAYTLQIGRQAFNHRRTIVCDSIDSAIAQLQTPHPSPLTPHPHSIAFLFAGQGSQYTQMGRDLYESEPVFRSHFDDCCDRFRPHLNLRQLLYSADTRSPIPDTQTAQPALFAIEYALAQLWLSWGVQPQAMLGHSIGEYVAATLAGVFSLNDAIALVAARGQLMQSCPPGAMLSVALPEAELRSLPDGLSLAVINAPRSCVVSGTVEAIAAFEQHLTQQEIPCRRLQTSHAFHSPLVESIVQPFIDRVQTVKLSPPKLPFISNVTGTWITSEQATDPHYWGQHLRQPVRFADGLATLKESTTIYLEVGAGRTLSSFVKSIDPDALILNSLRHPQENITDSSLILNSLGKLWSAGVEINWSNFHQHKQRQRLPLPTYPFEHQQYWIDLHSADTKPAISHSKNPNIDNWFYLPSWKRTAPIALPKLAPQTWLICLDKSGLGEAIAQQLEQFEQTVIRAKAEDDYQQFLSQPLDRIIYLWNNFHSFISLVQAIPASHSTQITILSKQLFDVTGESIDPAKATLLGACKVIPQEYPNLRCRAIDITDSTNINQLIAELTSAEDAIVAHRNHHRWIQTFESLPLAPQEPLLKQQGVYLIAGDLVEGLGTIFAQYFAKKAQAKLILIGRSTLPDRSNWETWLATHRQQDSVSRCLQTLQEIAAQGTELHFFTANLDDEERMRSIANQINQQFDQIHGIIHADTMGDRASCLIRSLDQAEIDRQFRSKITGLQILDRLFQATDFYLLQSSLSSIVGGVGFAAYAATNSFMDAYANQHNCSKIPWISVNWDAIQFEKANTNTGAALIDTAMTPAEVYEVVDRILSHPQISQIAVSPTSLETRIQQAAQQETPATSSHTRPKLSTNYVAPQNEIEQTVAIAMQELLGIEKIGVHDNFFELGGHSLLAIQAVSRLRETYQVELPMRAFLFEAPTVAEIAKIIAENQAENDQAIAALLDQVEQMDQQQINTLLGENHGL